MSWFGPPHCSPDRSSGGRRAPSCRNVPSHNRASRRPDRPDARSPRPRRLALRIGRAQHLFAQRLDPAAEVRHATSSAGSFDSGRLKARSSSRATRRSPGPSTIASPKIRTRPGTDRGAIAIARARARVRVRGGQVIVGATRRDRIRAAMASLQNNPHASPAGRHAGGARSRLHRPRRALGDHRRAVVAALGATLWVLKERSRPSLPPS